MFICDICGNKYGTKKPGYEATWHYGKCVICQKENVPVTEKRDFGYINREKTSFAKDVAKD